jgi:hypothetical protein
MRRSRRRPGGGRELLFSEEIQCEETRDHIDAYLGYLT